MITTKQTTKPKLPKEKRGRRIKKEQKAKERNCHDIIFGGKRNREERKTEEK